MPSHTRELSHLLFARNGIHHCPNCHGELVIKVLEKTFHHFSIDAQYFDVGSDDHWGNIKYVWDEFYCRNCEKWFVLGKIKEYEKTRKKGIQPKNIDYYESKRHHLEGIIEKKTILPDYI